MKRNINVVRRFVRCYAGCTDCHQEVHGQPLRAPLRHKEIRQVCRSAYITVFLFGLLLVGTACGDILAPDRAKPSAPPHSERATKLHQLTETPPVATTTPTVEPASTIASPVLADTEMVVLQQATGELHCSPHVGIFGQPGISIEGDIHTYYRGCTLAAGHGTAIRIQRYPLATDAKAAFKAKCDDQSLQSFHGFQACEWQFDERPENPQMPLRHRYQVWVADRWLVIVEAFDDTHFAIAPDPEEVSEAVYRAAQAAGLFSAE